MKVVAFLLSLLTVAAYGAEAGARVGPSAARDAGRAPQVALEQGRTAYARGDYQGTVEAIRPLIYPDIDLSSEDAVVEAHKLLALAYFFQKKEHDAEEEVSAVLALRPNYQLDPVVDPPMAVRFFQTIQKRQDERLREIERRQKEESDRAAREEERRRAEARAKAEKVYIDRRVERHSRLIAMIPFGVGQFQNGHKKLGTFFATSEAVLGGLSLGLFLAVDQLYPGGRVKPDEKNTANLLQTLQIASGVAFWVTALAGIIDAQVRYKPFVVLEQKERQKPKISLSPVLSPSLWGLGVQGAF